MTRESVTEILRRATAKDGDAIERLLPLVYDELRALAGRHLRSERPDHTLQPTALVHEAYLKLVDQTRVDWRGRGHFLAVASLAMRRLLVDHARARRRERRGGGAPKLSLSAALPVADDSQAEEIVAVDRLLDALAGFDPRAAKVVECRFFGGLSIEETAAALELSPMTVKRSWRVARAWLRRELGESA
jgi:RNA polymerase sigma factor (TIGR02999 family)